jgi:hypothetical protein
MRMASVMTGNESLATRLYEQTRNEATAIVDQCWPLVEAIAKALNKRGRLSIDELWMVMRGERLPKRPRTVELDEPELAIRVDGYFLGNPRPPLPGPRQLARITREFKERYAARGARFGEPIYSRSA